MHRLLTAESGLPIGLRLGTDDADATHAVLHAAGAEIGEEVLRLISHRRCSLSATPTTTCSSQLRIGKKRTPASNAGDLTRLGDGQQTLRLVSADWQP